MGKPSPHIPCRNHYFNISLISIVHKNIGNTCMISGTFVNVLFSLFLCCYQMFATSRLTHTQERGRFQTSHKTPNGCPINMEWTCKLVLLLPMLRESIPWILILEPDSIRLQQTPNDTNIRQQTPKKAVQGCAAVRVDMEWRLLVSVSVLCCLEMWRGCLRSF